MICCCLCYFLWGKSLPRSLYPSCVPADFFSKWNKNAIFYNIQQSYSCSTVLCISKVSLKVLSSSYMDLGEMSFERLHLRFLEISARPPSVS